MTIHPEWQTNHPPRLGVRAAAYLFAALLVAAMSGCASTPKSTSSGKVAASDIKLYESTELLHSQYSLVEHVWVDSWRSNIDIPSFNSEAEGIDAMKRIASDVGANALLHATCVDARKKSSDNPRLYCYGDAIRLN